MSIKMTSPEGRTIEAPSQHIEYETHSMKDLRAECIVDPKTGKKKIQSVMVGDRPVTATPRFRNSLYSKFGFSGQMFNYFSPAEVFDRIAQKKGDEQLRICFQTEPGSEVSSLLAVSNPGKGHLPFDNVIDILLAGNPTGNITLADGVLRSSYTPRGEAGFKIGGDDFEARFDTLIPIDGYGHPSTVLGTYRLVCANGLVALARMFSDKIPSSGKDTDGGLARIIQTLESFGNDEGYSALRSRLESATTSYASVAECTAVSKAVFQAMQGGKANDDREAVKNMLDAFDRLTGNFVTMYGLVNENAIGKKRLSTLPSRATVYDLMNFGTEIATHHVPNEVRRRQVQGIIGEMLGKEYDLEGSGKDGRDFIDVYIDADKETAKHAVTEDDLEDMTNETFMDE
jgi:hypothetical protein